MTSTTKQCTKWLSLYTPSHGSSPRRALPSVVPKASPRSVKPFASLPRPLSEGAQHDTTDTKKRLRELRQGLRLNNVELTWNAFRSLPKQQVDSQHLSHVVRLLLKEDPTRTRFPAKYKEISRYIEGNQHAFNCLRGLSTLIACQGALGQWKRATEKYTLAKTRFSKQLDVVFFTEMINIFSGLSVSMVGEIKKDMESRGVRLNDRTFNALLKASKIHQDPVGLTQFYREMIDSGIGPDVVTFNTLISAYSKLNDIAKVEQIYKEMRERKVWPDRITFNTLIKAFAGVSQVDRAMEVYRIMQRKGVPPDAVTYNSLIDTFMRQKNFEASIGIYKSMIKRGVQPTVVTYTTLIHGCVKDSKLAQAHQLYKEMSSHGIAPNAVTFSTLINGFIQGDQIHAANTIYQDMVNRRICPDTVIFTNLIHGHVKNCKMSKAMQVFRDMSHLGCPPSIVTYSILINGFVKSYDMKQAAMLYKDLVAAGLHPTAVTLNTLLSGYSKALDMQTAFEIFQEFPKHKLEPDVVTYNILMEACFRSNRVDSGFKLYQELLAKDIPPTTFTYAVLMNHYNFTGQIQKLMELWEEVKPHYPKNELTALVSVLIDSHGFHQDLQSLETTWDSLNKEGILLNENNYNSYLEALCRHRAFSRAIEVFRGMDGCGVLPTVKTCMILIHSLRANRRFSDLLEIYHYLETSQPPLFQLINPLPPKQETVDDATYAYLESILGQRKLLH
ncbi:hypothetical protein K493DRAFT_302265 [Basidiobolus meristosporus CBS 931.73]|uniref:TPR-like protein n=1 Tax=Basidiobolus meristosporus CBS 931.73 TaxID=1314790 RepID=A0A1Y1Y7U2_9FUNG|nr:hypothetical protein K493DRAFT_302265 [Basidiobolus meristosporus CBS 931.73]|eukprot:ORX94081.1 hypothetical protein K493DRAFT_302265 [Basidiobolus meristosporus CBS 931.73]